MRSLVRSLQAEGGQALIEGLLALGLVLLVVVVAVQGLAYAHARSVAAAAAQDGARTAAVGGANAGVASPRRRSACAANLPPIQAEAR
jgi:hypothetical protein